MAVESETPLARKGRGMISGGYSLLNLSRIRGEVNGSTRHGTGPQLIPNAAL